MLNHASDAEIGQGWIPPFGWWGPHLLQQTNQAQKWPGCLDDVPVMSATVLGLDMILHEPQIDLRMASELVLGDIGATIKTFQLINKEYDFAEGRPSRMGDCLASLDVTAWFSAISSRLFACDREHSATTAVWKHCRLVAKYAQLVAESLDHISPEDAYLVGLLHGIGAIPRVLGYKCGNSGSRATSLLMALEEALPPFVLAALRSTKGSSPLSEWRFILIAAHELAATGANFDSSICHDMNSLPVCSR